MSNLIKGDIVTDTDYVSRFFNKQGQVSRVYANGTVMVRFPAASLPDHYFDFNEERHDLTISFKGDEATFLRKDKDWDPRLIPIVTDENFMQVIDELLDLPFWPEDLNDGEIYQVQTDDTDGSPEYGWLMAQFTCDGDLHLRLTCDRGIPHDFRLRTYAGGGSHLRVRNAGLILAYAMKLDMKGNA